MERLIFVRHGESQHTVQGLMGGWVESPLTEHGERQVGAVADHLAQLNLSGVTQLYTSDLKRAVQTSSVIGKTLNLRPIEMRELREINTGDAAGLSKADVAKVNGPAPELPDLIGDPIAMPRPTGRWPSGSDLPSTTSITPATRRLSW